MKRLALRRQAHGAGVSSPFTTSILHQLPALARLVRSTLVPAALLMLVASRPVSAATYTWDSDGTFSDGITDGSGTWNLTNLNWYLSTNIADIAWTNNTTDIAEFGANGSSTGGTVTVSGNFSAGGLQFGAATSNTFSGSYTINGAGLSAGSVMLATPITLGTTSTFISVNSGAGAVTIGSSANPLTIAMPAGGSPTITNASSNMLTLNASLFTSTANQPTLTIAGAGSTTINGTITDGVNKQANISKSGAGTLTLNAVSQFSGNVTVNGSSGPIQLGNPLALQLAQSAVDGSTNSTVTLSTANGLTFASSANTAPFIIGDLTGSNESLLDTSGNPITLQVGAIGNNGWTYSGVLSGTNANLTMGGFGKLTLTKAADTYTGLTTINSGTLITDFSQSGSPTSNIISPSSGLVLAGGTYQATVGSSGTDSQTFNGVALNAGSSTITTSGSATLSLTLGPITRNAGSALEFLLPTAGSITTTTANSSFSGDAATILGYATVEPAGGAFGGTTWAVSASNGTTPGAISSLTPGTPVATLTSNADNNLATGTDTGATTANQTVNSLLFNSTAASQTFTLNLGSSGTGGAHTLIVATGGILITSGPATTNFHPTVNIDSAGTGANASSITSGNGQDLLIIDNSSNTLTIGANVTDNGSNSIGLTVTRQNSGTDPVVLSGSNTFSGGLTIGSVAPSQSGTGSYGGEVSVSAISDTSPNTSNIGYSSGGSNPITLVGGQFAYTGSSSTSTGRNIVLSSSQGGEISTTNSVTLTLTGSITSSGPMMQPFTDGGGNASAVEILGGSTDNTNLLISAQAGVLELDKISSAGAPHAAYGVYNVASNACLKIATGATSGIQIANSGSVTVSSGGTFDLNNDTETITSLYLNGSGGTSSGFNNNNNGALMNSGTGSAALTATNGVFLFSNGSTGTTISVPNAGLTLNGNISGGASTPLTKAGIGTLTLNGNNLYTGATTVNVGTLAVSGSSGGTAITVGNATIATANGTSSIPYTTGNATLQVSGNYTIGSSTAGSLTVVGGNGTSSGQGTLDMRDTTINTLTFLNATSGATNFTLGGSAAGSPSIIYLDYNSSATDQIAVGQKMVLNAGGAVINLNALSGASLAPSTYNLITYGSETYTGTFTFPGGGSTQTVGTKLFTLQNTATAEQLVVTSISTPIYWTGGQGTAWNMPALSPTNWSSDPGGMTDANAIPGATNDVYFAATGAGNLNTTLGQDFSISGLIFNSAAIGAVAIGGANTLTINSDGIAVQSGAPAATISSSVAVGAAQIWTNASGSPLTISGVLSGSSSFGLTIGSATATGTIILSNPSNSYGGTVTISGGTLQLGDGVANNGSLGGNIVDNAALVFANPSLQSFSGNISGSGTLTMNGPGALSLGGALSYFGATTINAGSLAVNGSLTNSSLVTVGNGATLAGTGSVGSPVSLSGGATGSTLSSSGTLSLGSTLSVNGLNNQVSSGTISIGGATTINGGGSLRVASAGTISTTALTTVANTGSLQINGTLTVTGGGSTTINNSGSVQVGDGSSNNGSISGNILDNGALTFANPAGASYGGTISGGGTLTKNAAGALSLGGTSGYSGATAVNAGTLTVNGSITNSSLVTVGDGATLAGTGAINSPVSLSGGTTGSTLTSAATLTLGGTLSVSGANNQISGGTISVAGTTTINSGGTLRVAGTISGGGSTSVSGTLSGTGMVNQPVTIQSGGQILAGSGATLTLGSLSLAPGSSSSFALTTMGANNPTALVTVSGALIGPGSPGGHTLSFTGSAMAGSIYELYSFTGTAPNLSDFALAMGTLSTYSIAVVSPMGMTPGQVDLNIAQANGSATWNTNAGAWSGATNWTPNQFPSANTQTATFNGSGATNPTVNVTVDGAYTVGGMTFDSTSTAYTLVSGGAGTGLTFNNNATAGGGFINVNSGTHTIGADLTLADVAGTTITVAGSSSLNITGSVGIGGNALVVRGAGATTIGGAITGASSVSMNGSGILTLGATNSYGGGTSATAGTLRTTADGALGSGALFISAAAVNLGGNENIGSLSMTSSSGSLSVAAGKTLTVTQSAGDTTAAGAITLTAGAGSNPGGALVKAGSSTLEIDAAPTLGQNSSLTVNDTGTLRLNVTSGTPSVGPGVTATVGSTATLELDGGVSALVDPTATNPPQRTQISNSGSLVVGNTAITPTTTQQVGGIDGTGNTTVSDSASLTADHINQTSLVIGNGSTFTLAPSGMDGEPMASGGAVGESLILAGSLTPATGFVANSGSLLGAASSASSPSAASLGGVGASSASAVPEPSAIVMAAFGVLAILPLVRRKRPPAVL